jgi:prophage regulatory protein
MTQRKDSGRKLINFAELRPRFGVPFTRRHLLTLEAKKKFPARVQVGEHRVAWVESEVQDWIDGKVEARNGI